MTPPERGSRDYPAAPVVGIAAIVRRGDRVLLVQRLRPPHRGMWGFPGGRQELGETIAAGAIRELREETGVIADNARFVAALDVIDRDDAGGLRYHYTVLVMRLDWRAGEGEAGDDAAAVGWFDAGEIDAMPVLPDTKSLIAKAGV